MNKVFSSPDAAVADIPSGSTVMLGGFGLCGIPENAITALVKRGVTGLHTISNNMGVDGFGLGLLLEAGMIASHTGSYVGENALLEKLVIAGTLKVTLSHRGLWQSGFAPGERAFLPFTRRRVWARWSRRARRSAPSRGAGIYWRRR
jgi:3-oxoacid CoA-transferase subunit A